MRAPCAALRLLLATTLQLQCCATTVSPHHAGKAEPVIRFLDVFNRSTCQPKETMVSLDNEYPDLLADHIVLPSCVLLKRCAGCCADELLKCVPTQTHKVVMEVMLRKFEHGHVDRLTFEEHTQCACRPRTFVRLKSLSSSCAPCLNRRKWLDPQTCQCSCRHDAVRCEHRGLKVNEANCRCMHLRRSRSRKAKTVS